MQAYREKIIHALNKLSCMFPDIVVLISNLWQKQWEETKKQRKNREDRLGEGENNRGNSQSVPGTQKGKHVQTVWTRSIEFLLGNMGDKTC